MGTWAGTISQKTLYVEGRPCRVAAFNPAKGVQISPDLGSAYLVDRNHRLIDPCGLDPSKAVTVTGIGQMVLVFDAKGRSAEPKDAPEFTEVGAIRVQNVSLGRGAKLNLRLIDAGPPALQGR